MLGDYGSWTKTSPRRASTGVPLVVAGPGVESRGRVSEPANLLDLHATFLAYAGLDPGDVSSRSLRPYLEGQTGDHRAVVRSRLDPYDAEPWRLVFDGRYELIVGDDLPTVNGLSEEYDSPVLFDLESDTGKRTDVSAVEPSVVAHLSSYLPEGFEVD